MCLDPVSADCSRGVGAGDLIDYERILSAKHPDTLGVRNNLANAYEVVRRTEDAERVRKPLSRGDLADA